jgi:hypothetical protein
MGRKTTTKKKKKQDGVDLYFGGIMADKKKEEEKHLKSTSQITKTNAAKCKTHTHKRTYTHRNK